MTNDINDLEELIPDIDPGLKSQFENFFSLLEQYNLKINLISKNSLPRAGAKHFSDCYQGLKFVEPHFIQAKPLYDFGAGNGFPGIVAAMMFPSQKIILIERDQRKAEFLKFAADHLSLKNIEVKPISSSELTVGGCDIIMSRAMSPLPKFLLENRQLVPMGGKAFLFKADHWSTEFSAIPPQLFEFWDVNLVGQYELPLLEGSRFIIQCDRV